MRLAHRPRAIALPPVLTVLLVACSSTSPFLPLPPCRPPFVASVSAMRIVVQRVKRASVRVDGGRETVSSIGPGIMALVGLHEHDTETDLAYCCRKLLAAKLWPNDNGAMWRQGVKQRGLEVLCVSQFTLYGTLSKKNQPDYKRAMKAIPAEALYDKFLRMLAENYQEDKIFDGKFGALMDVDLVNDGPVTIMIESDPTPGRMEDGAESNNGESSAADD